MEFDTSKISFVFCGSFETPLTRKREINSSIGFGKAIDKSDISVEYKNKIKTENLMTYAGVRYLKSRIQELLDEQMFLGSEKEEYLPEA